MLLAAGLAGSGADLVLEGIVELGCLKELLDGEVHSVAPVVARICGNVDQLIARILTAELAVHRQPVLQREDCKH